ncbi:MAG: hypothetical protein IJI75_03430 [Solobacterium sp.]|nr:hypothetical protein [Solobacterium sp.]
MRRSTYIVEPLDYEVAPSNTGKYILQQFEAGLTMTAIADELGVSKQTISKFFADQKSRKAIARGEQVPLPKGPKPKPKPQPVLPYDAATDPDFYAGLIRRHGSADIAGLIAAKGAAYALTQTHRALGAPIGLRYSTCPIGTQRAAIIYMKKGE